MSRAGAVVVAAALVGAPLVAWAADPGAAGFAGERRGRAAEHYLLHCSGCHGPDGRGIPGVTPSLHGLAALAETAVGRSYLLRVPGVAQAPLSDAELAALLDWVLERFSEASGAATDPPLLRFDPREVARWRSRPLRDPLAARRALPGDGSTGAVGDAPAVP
jgi:mono/diheme cytochrome c family protein